MQQKPKSRGSMISKPRPSIDDILSDILLRNLCMKFLKKRYADENLAFLLLVNHLRLSSDELFCKLFAVQIWVYFSGFPLWCVSFHY